MESRPERPSVRYKAKQLISGVVLVAGLTILGWGLLTGREDRIDDGVLVAIVGTVLSAGSRWLQRRKHD